MASCFGKPCPFPLPAKDFQGPSLQARRASVQQTERLVVAKERKPPNMKYHAHTVKSADLGPRVQQFYLASIQTLVKNPNFVQNPKSKLTALHKELRLLWPKSKIENPKKLQNPKSKISESKTAPFRAAK